MTKAIYLAVLAMLGLSSSAASAQPVPAPGIEIVNEGCGPCPAGALGPVVLRVSHAGPPRNVWLVAVLRFQSNEWSLRSESVTLSAGLSEHVLVGHVALPTNVRGPGTPPIGIYLIEAALLDDMAGVTLARQTIGIPYQ
jgi:hypothetical protein